MNAPTAIRSFHCASTFRPLCALGPGHCAERCSLAEQATQPPDEELTHARKALEIFDRTPASGLSQELCMMLAAGLRHTLEHFDLPGENPLRKGAVATIRRLPDACHLVQWRGSVYNLARIKEALPAWPAATPRWKHVNGGTTYTEIGRGQLKQDEGSLGWRDCVIYRADADGALYARPVEQFEGGRFERIDHASEPLACQADSEGGETD